MAPSGPVRARPGDEGTRKAGRPAAPAILRPVEITPPELLPERLRQTLAGPARGLVQAVVDEALARGPQPFLVGGCVRDLLLGQAPAREPLDLDVVLEGGDALPVAEALAARHGWRLTAHRRFRTATLQAGPVSLDLATARRERYPRPGVLPVVETPATLDQDLFRRDFTINAMALGLAPEAFGRLRDPYGGHSDLAAGLLRVLHDRSFQDDATRLWRACRYAVRLGLRLERQTSTLARRDAAFVMSVGPDRVRHELERIYLEPRPERALALAHRYGLLAQVHPALEWDRWLARRFVAARRLYSGTAGQPGKAAAEGLAWRYWGLLVYRLPARQLSEVLRSLRITGRHAAVLESLPSLKRAVARLAPGSRPSSIARRLDPFDLAAVQLAGLAQEPPARRRLVARYLARMRPLRPTLRGDDLTALGVGRGPALGRILGALRAARLDKRVKTREDETALVRRLLRAGRRGRRR